MKQLANDYAHEHKQDNNATILFQANDHHNASQPHPSISHHPAALSNHFGWVCGVSLFPFCILAHSPTFAFHPTHSHPHYHTAHSQHQSHHHSNQAHSQYQTPHQFFVSFSSRFSLSTFASTSSFLTSCAYQTPTRNHYTHQQQPTNTYSHHQSEKMM